MPELQKGVQEAVVAGESLDVIEEEVIYEGSVRKPCIKV